MSRDIVSREQLLALCRGREKHETTKPINQIEASERKKRHAIPYGEHEAAVRDQAFALARMGLSVEAALPPLRAFAENASLLKGADNKNVAKVYTN